MRNIFIFRSMIGIIVIITVVCFITQGIVKLTYANSEKGSPDFIITINKSGGLDYQGNLFGNGLWYPGAEKIGVIRINNNYQLARISDLGLNVDIINVKEGYDKTQVTNSFLDNMNLTVKKGSMFVFENTILDGKTFFELCNGVELVDSQQFSINTAYPVDLEYRLKMDEEAGDELERLEASVDFKIGVTGSNQEASE